MDESDVAISKKYHAELADYFTEINTNDYRTAQEITSGLRKTRNVEKLVKFFRENAKATWIQDTQKSMILQVGF